MKPVLYKCVPKNFLWMPKGIRMCLGYFTMCLFSFSFLTVPFCCVLLIPSLWRKFPWICGSFSLSLIVSMVYRSKEWPAMRRVGQLWFDLLDFSCNLSPEKITKTINDGETNQYIIGMHPHGIVPFQAILWAAYCDLYLSDPVTKRALYGFGAAADVVQYLPFLKNIMAWLSAGSADYKVLFAGLSRGECFCVNAAGRTPRHLYILPGGIAEVFSSKPGSHAVKFKTRKGLIRLSLETGAQLIPTYVFGGTDFFNNLLTGDGFLSNFFRKLRMGVTIFWGYLGLPLPFLPKVSMCIADPIPVKKWEGPGPIPQEIIDELHSKYLQSLKELFDNYKEQAGYANAELLIE